MLTALSQLAELEDSTETSGVIQYLNDPKSKTTTHANFLMFHPTDQNQELKYQGLSGYEKISEDIEKYLYPIKKYRPANGTYKTPTIVYTEYDKSYLKKIFAWFKDNHTKNALFNVVYQAMVINAENIKNDLGELDKNTFLSIRINNQYIGEIPSFVSLFVDDKEFIKGISKDEKWQQEHAVCMVCFEPKEIVYGNAVPYPFFTVDKEGFAYNFEQNNSAKQVPICVDCAKKVGGAGRHFLEQNLSFRLCGTEYFIIPEMIGYMPSNDLLNKTVEKLKRGRTHLEEVSQLKDNFGAVVRAENSILRDFSGEPDFLSLNLLFYKRENSQFSILASIDEVLPSYLNKLYKAIRALDDQFRNHHIVIHTAKEDKEVEFSYRIISTIFEKEEIRIGKRSKKEFFEVLNSLLTLRPLSYHYVINTIAHGLHKYAPGHIHGDSTAFFKFKHVSFEGFYFINLLMRLGLLNQQESGMNHEESVRTANTPVLDKLICGEFKEFFKSPVRKAVFGLGILTEQLAYIQFKERQSKSVYKKLRNFKVDLQYLQNTLIPELKDKFHAYKKETKIYTTLFSEISNGFIAAGDTTLSAGETSFIFTLGINLSYELIKKRQEESQKELQPVS